MSTAMDIDSQPAGGPSTSATASTDIQLPINLFTRDPSQSIPSSTYLIPASWRRFQLSELINKVLSTSTPGAAPVPFEFIVEGELLRTTLDAWVKANRNGDVESTINVEYIRSLLPPKQVGTWNEDDWVSGVSLKMPGYILLSSYLSHLKILPMSATTSTVTSAASHTTSASTDVLYTLPLPTSLGATCCAWLSPPSSSTESSLVAAGSLDRLTHVFTVPSLLSPDQLAATEVLTLHGHTGPITSVQPSRSYDNVLTSSWDGTVNLYPLPSSTRTLESLLTHDVEAEPASYLPGANRSKKRRTAATAESSSGEAQAKGEGVSGYRKAPIMTLRGHSARVGGVVWDRTEGGRAWSVAWDGTVRGWDVESGYGDVVKQGPSDRAGLCIDQLANTGKGTLITGGMDRTVCLWDTREASSIISLILPTPSPVPSVAAHPTSPHLFSAATYSGLLQIWDVRSPKSPLFSVNRSHKEGKERVLSVDWDGEILVAGGEDGEVGVWLARGQ